jgi:hypothetical protein
MNKKKVVKLYFIIGSILLLFWNILVNFGQMTLDNFFTGVSITLVSMIIVSMIFYGILLLYDMLGNYSLIIHLFLVGLIFFGGFLVALIPLAIGIVMIF